MLRRMISVCVLTAMALFAFTNSAIASFGLEGFELSASEASSLGSPLGTFGPAAVQAGTHPFALATSFKFNTKPGFTTEPIPDGDVKNIEVELPGGFVGNPSATPKCTLMQFNTPNPNIDFGLDGSSCPDDTQVGVARVEITPSGNGKPFPFTLGIYNLVAPPGVPAEFGFNPIGIPIVVTPQVRTGGDYGVTVASRETSQGQRIFGATTIFWGVPADPSHNGFRGECLGAEGESLADTCSVETPRKAFLRLPTSCPTNPQGEVLPFSAKIRADSWQEPGQFVEKEASNESEGHPVGIIGCEHLDFSPTITVQPAAQTAASPTGLSVRLHLPQNENPDGLGEADLRKAVVSLPVGVSISPSAANGLESCSEAQISLHSNASANCPDASKVGTVEVTTPLLEAPLTGSVYVATPYENPSGGLLELYVVAEGSGVLIKLAGEVTADPTTGQLTTTFEETPQQPFSELKLNVFGGPRAALMTPLACGAYQTTGALTPWSGTVPVTFATPPVSFSGCGGGFSPSFVAGTVTNQAGGFSPFTFRLQRSDTDQDFKSLNLTMPPGLLGMLSKVTLCGEPQAALGTCPASSQIGHVSAGAGPGPDPVFVPQSGKPQDPVFLTGPYNGAPFGLSIVIPPEAGPFNLGPPVVVRSAISVDPHSAQITIASDPFPTILKGIPLHVKTVDVTVDRNEFIFNPTSCNPLALNATVASAQNATAALSSRFQASSCASLGFAPKFTASTQSKASKSNGASLDVKIGYPKGPQANIASVKVALPLQLPSRLTTIQKACPAATFAANPATCSAGSNIGTAIATTPVLNTPVRGPVYLVSHGGAAFPDIVMILQGQGVRLDVVGNINIAKGITTSSFSTVPDAPISSFELKLPTGPHSALTRNLPAKAKLSFCHTTLTMPTTINAQNGARVTQNTKIAVTGCPKVKKVKTKSRRR